MEMWKSGGNELRIQLLELFNKIIDKNQMPQEWETGMVKNIHKERNKKPMCKLQRNYFIAHSLQTIYKYNKKTD
jgi:purine nucleoside permease